MNKVWSTFDMSSIWESTKPPLDHLYDAWLGEGNWDEQKVEVVTCTIFSLKDMDWGDGIILAGCAIPCTICGHYDRWVPEGSTLPLAHFVCEHAPIWVGRFKLRQVCTINFRNVGEVRGLPHNLRYKGEIDE